MQTMTHDRRSPVLPVVLIGIGVLWLLGNLNIGFGANFAMLFRLWPLFLIIIGLNLLFKGKSPELARYIALGGIALIVVLMLIGPAVGLVSSQEIKTAQYSEPVEDARSARVNLNLPVGTTTLKALGDSANLIEADLSYIGEVEFTASGSTEKVVSLMSKAETTSFSWPDNWFGWDGRDLYWNVALNPDVLLDLDVNGGVGESILDLSDLKLSDVTVNVGVGEMSLSLPAMENSYRVEVNGGVGEVKLNLPEGAAVRLEAQIGIGDIDIDSSLVRISHDDDNFLGENGVWQTPGFDSADQRITITFHGGLGGLEVDQ